MDSWKATPQTKKVDWSPCYISGTDPSYPSFSNLEFPTPILCRSDVSLPLHVAFSYGLHFALDELRVNKESGLKRLFWHAPPSIQMVKS